MERIIIMHTFVLDNQRGYQNFKTNSMKQTKTAKGFINLERKKDLVLEFIRFGEKGEPNTKELFWLSKKGGFTLNDLRKIAKEAEELIKMVDE